MARLQQGNFVSLFTGMSQIFIAAVILTVLFAVNIIGTKQAAVVNTIICAVMTGAILAFAAFGLPKADFPYIFQTGHLFYKGVPNFMAALALFKLCHRRCFRYLPAGRRGRESGQGYPACHDYIHSSGGNYVCSGGPGGGRSISY